MAVSLVAGCAPCAEGYDAPQSVASGVELGLRGVGFMESDDFVAIGDAGVIVYEEGGALQEAKRPVATDLNAITAEALDGEMLAVGAQGVILSSRDPGKWVAGDSKITSDLWGVVHVEQAAGRFAVAVGDGVVLSRDGGADTWETISPSTGAWGQLRGIHATAAELYVVGLAGTIWSTSDPHGSWNRDESGTEMDLLAVGGTGEPLANGGDAGEVYAVGAEGTLLRRKQAGRWESLVLDSSATLVGVARDVVVASDGEVFQVRGDGGGAERLFGVGFPAHAVAFHGTYFMVVGDNGQMRASSRKGAFCNE